MTWCCRGGLPEWSDLIEFEIVPVAQGRDMGDALSS